MPLNGYTHTHTLCCWCWVVCFSALKKHTSTDPQIHFPVSALVNCPPPCLCFRFFHQKRRWKSRSRVGEGDGGTGERERERKDCGRRRGGKEDVHIWSCTVALSLEERGGSAHSKAPLWIYLKTWAGGEMMANRKGQRQTLNCVMLYTHSGKLNHQQLLGSRLHGQPFLFFFSFLIASYMYTHKYRLGSTQPSYFNVV